MMTLVSQQGRDIFSGKELGLKATINERGILKITAETPLESYALKRWENEYRNGEHGELEISTINELREEK